MFLEKQQELRYGENPHQQASFYREPGNILPNITNARQHQGKELSFNNIMDADAAFELVKEFKEPTVAIIKHAVPCGVAIGNDVNTAYEKAYLVDTKSPFGGVVAMNQECNKELVEKLTEFFLEIVIAPSFSEEALEIFKKKEKLRVLETGGIDIDENELAFKKVSGGLLVQEKNHANLEEKDLKQVSKRMVSENEKADMLFAWKIIKHVKSNAIVLAKDGVTVGIGAGQTSRVDAVEIACKKAGEHAQGAVMASDAFFPFSDGIEVAAPCGITAVIHPGGSLKDKEVEAKVDELKLGMLYCGQRAFLH
ncbi:bifunctional phosphoribosylaminoimidazolecarboxamide formyltransferase/IMP cyclohydrolase, partial [Candidatus Peregrinibacteria bacterium]|nr:bifunctional phosphoribosylaminoimidazolecarboxamide formyltransferase/IMP cyclohydrolase [Candidatus Peregrinibacteria bacterium]